MSQPYLESLLGENKSIDLVFMTEGSNRVILFNKH